MRNYSANSWQYSLGRARPSVADLDARTRLVAHAVKLVHLLSRRVEDAMNYGDLDTCVREKRNACVVDLPGYNVSA